MKKLGIMQPYLFPYIGYFQLLNAVDEYVIYDDVQYIKRGWINRNYILEGNTRARFTISLNKASSEKLINEIEIKDDFTKFLKKVSMAYSKAPYREPTLTILNKICSYSNKNLAHFTGNSIEQLANYLDIGTQIIYSSELKKDSKLKGQDKILAICKERHADTYINPIGGMELYNQAEFTKGGVDLKFLKSKQSKYKQFKSNFTPGLSIIDVMMFNSPQSIKKMLDEYELI